MADHAVVSTPASALVHPGVNERAYWLLAHLSLRIDPGAEKLIRREDLVRELNRSPSTIDRSLRELERAGYLSRDRERTIRGGPLRIRMGAVKREVASMT
jgi:DNA-binding IclR family transcriptional regulator